MVCSDSEDTVSSVLLRKEVPRKYCHILMGALQELLARLEAVEAACDIPPSGKNMEARLERLEALGSDASVFSSSVDDDDDDDDNMASVEERDRHGRVLVRLTKDSDVLRVIEHELRCLSRRIDSNEKEDEDRQGQQDARDEAQDCIIKMEFARLAKDMKQTVRQDDLESLTCRVDAKLEAVSAKAKKIVDETVSRLRLDVQGEMEDLMSGLKLLTESNTKSNQLLDSRVARLESRAREVDAKMDDSTQALKAQIYAVDRSLKSAASHMRDSIKDHAGAFAPRLSVLEARLDELNSATMREAQLRRRQHEEFDANQQQVVKTLANLRAEASQSKEVLSEKIAHEKSQRICEYTALRQRLTEREAGASETMVLMDKIASQVSKAQVDIDASTRKRETKDDVLEKKLTLFMRDHSALAASSAKWRETVYEKHQATFTTDLCRASQSLQALQATVSSQRDESRDGAENLRRTMADNFSSVHCELRNTSERLRSTTAIAEHAASQLASNEAKLQRHYDDFRDRLTTSVERLEEETLCARDTTVKALSQVEATVADQSSDYHETMARLQRSVVSQAATIRRVDALCSAVCCKAGSSSAFEAQIDEDARLLSRHCAEIEAVASSTNNRAFSLPYDERNFLSTAIQRVAERMALRADLECLRQILGSREDPSLDDKWDDVVQERRDLSLTKFLASVQQTTRRLHPSHDASVLEARGLFMQKLEICLKIALSKHQKIQANFTLFGRLGLGPSCVACDRPFLPSGHVSPLKQRGQQNLDHFYPIHNNKKDDVSFASADAGVVEHERDFGRHQPADYVKRGGGFKANRVRYAHVDEDDMQASASMPLFPSILPSSPFSSIMDTTAKQQR